MNLTTTTTTTTTETGGADYRNWGFLYHLPSFSVPYRRFKLCPKLCRRRFLVTLGCSGRAYAAATTGRRRRSIIKYLLLVTTVSSHHIASRSDQSRCQEVSFETLVGNSPRRARLCQAFLCNQWISSKSNNDWLTRLSGHSSDDPRLSL